MYKLLEVKVADVSNHLAFRTSQGEEEMKAVGMLFFIHQQEGKLVQIAFYLYAVSLPGFLLAIKTQ